MKQKIALIVALAAVLLGGVLFMTVGRAKTPPPAAAEDCDKKPPPNQFALPSCDEETAPGAADAKTAGTKDKGAAPKSTTPGTARPGTATPPQP